MLAPSWPAAARGGCDSRVHFGTSLMLSETGATPLDSLWRPPAILRVLLAGEAVALLLSLAPGVQHDWWTYFLLASLAINWVALLTLGALFLLRRELAKLKPLEIAYVALALLTTSTWVVAAAAVVLSNEFWNLSPGSWWSLLLRLTGISVTVGLLALAAFENHWLARQLALRAKQAELESLRARIRPHFLFNTLNTAAALVHARPGEAEQILLDLADLFRAALSGPREISLEEELALTRRYLEIELLRFGDRLSIRWNLPATLPAATVPTLSVQPLVENAIRHGVELSSDRTVVEITVEQRDSSIVISVSNDLPAADRSANRGHRIGQASTRARIEALAGDRGRLVTSVENGRYVATITLPQVAVAPRSVRESGTESSVSR
ncbi:MAG: histidine kinase [Pseudomonadota bacterium]|nr:histidine kinase [Pseudomonadota bacterium]